MEDVIDRISDEARAFRDWAANPKLFLESCDGGDPGSPATPSIWVMGIEPGNSLTDQAKEARGQKISAETLEAYSVDLQFGWPFNVGMFKILAALDGRPTEDYRSFATEKRPFERGCKGYFKGNLYPEAFHKIKSWDDGAVRATGFATKADYQAWMREVRFPILAAWIEKCRPALIIGVGLSHADDFLAVTHASEAPVEHSFEVNGDRKRLLLTRSGLAPLAIVPYPFGPNGLNYDESKAIAAQYIRSFLAQH